MIYAPYRRNDRLKRTTRASFPKRLMFIDTETKPVWLDDKSWRNVMHLGVLIYVELDDNAQVIKRNVHAFYNAYDLLSIIADYTYSKTRIIIIGHNIAFDIEVLNLPQILSDLGCQHTYPIKNGKTFIWRVKTGRSNLLFIDTANYAAGSLEQLGKDIELPKMTIDFDTCNDDELLAYCENDAMICEKFILEYIRFLLANDMGEMKLTIASQALTTFRYRFMTTAPKFHMNDKINEIEKYAYFGGRTEALQLGKITDIPIFNLDVSSEYPAAMIASKMPYELVGFNPKPISQALDYHLKHNYLIVDCTINTNLPVFPMRADISTTKENINVRIINNYDQMQSGFKIIYPIGTYRTWLHHNEFIYALDHNLVQDIHAYVVYKAAYLFNDFVQTLYSLKAQYATEGNKSFRHMTKIMQNSLYGKWGQEYHVTKSIAKLPNDKVEVTYGYSDKYGYTFTDIAWFGELFRTYQSGLSTYSFPAIAGAICSNARMILWNYREIAGHENNYYGDTDSLFVNQSGYDNLTPNIAPNELGKLELKGTSDNLIIYGNKDYEFGDEKVHKGIPPKALEIGRWQWEYMNFQGFKDWRNTGANNSPITQYQTKARRGLYDKGLLQENGAIHPYILQVGQSVYAFPLQLFEHRYQALFLQVQPILHPSQHRYFAPT